MNYVYMPFMTEDKEEFEIVMDMVPILYGRTPVKSTLIIDNTPILYWKVEINKQLGKTPLLNLLRYLGEDVILFSKGDKLYKKYIDTGIVEFFK